VVRFVHRYEQNLVMLGIWRMQHMVEKQGKDPRNPSRAVTYVTDKLMPEPKFRRR
jgi:hypothetical protein